MKVYCVDDSAMHLSRIKKVIEAAALTKGIAQPDIVELNNGSQLLQELQKDKPMLITLDINMPVLDGLSALVKLRHDKFHCKVVMVSSETELMVKRLAKTRRFDAEEEKKIEMLGKVVSRVQLGQEEEGKINSVLEACASLGLDPIDVASRYGANGFIQKPFEIDEAAQELLKYL